MASAGTMRISDNVARVRDVGVIPVVELNLLDEAQPLFAALSEAGLPVLEITLRTSAGLEALRMLRRLYPEGFIGAGTVLTIADADRVIEAGADFVVSPTTNPEVIEFCLAADVLVMPGACTPTEVDNANRAGAQLIKLFPAEAAGGRTLLKALAAPFHDLWFVPTGGINETNLAEYLRVPQVAACGGSWIVPADRLYNRDFAAIEAVARKARAIVSDVRRDG